MNFFLILFIYFLFVPSKKLGVYGTFSLYLLKRNTHVNHVPARICL